MAVEQRARELLASEWDECGDVGHNFAKGILAGASLPMNLPAVRAIIAALMPPEGYENVARVAARYNYLRSRLLDTCMWNDAGVLIFCDERNGPELDELIDSEIDGRPEVPDGRQQTS